MVQPVDASTGIPLYVVVVPQFPVAQPLRIGPALVTGRPEVSDPLAHPAHPVLIFIAGSYAEVIGVLIGVPGIV